MKNIKLIMMLLFICSNTHTSNNVDELDDFNNKLNDTYSSIGAPVDEFYHELKNLYHSDQSCSDKMIGLVSMLGTDLQDQIDFLAQEGSSSKTNNPDYFKFLQLVSVRKVEYAAAEGQQQKSIAMKNLIDTISVYSEQEKQKKEQKEKMKMKACIDAHRNTLRKLSIQQSVAQTSQAMVKDELPITTREQRRTAQKEAVKAAKKAAKTIK